MRVEQKTLKGNSKETVILVTNVINEDGDFANSGNATNEDSASDSIIRMLRNNGLTQHPDGVWR